ncbi:conserved hypothetical protein [Ricinus communis]|uniref:Uncharacterized protein n=1 Tax=Ricinus communis TaxID=3988 RepID=B9TQ83_RICCO|nr:conserved hypothetical protein [Ricinus communis]
MAKRPQCAVVPFSQAFHPQIVIPAKAGSRVFRRASTAVERQVLTCRQGGGNSNRNFGKAVPTECPAERCELRYSPGVTPVQVLKARRNELVSRKPIRKEISPGEMAERVR